MATASLPKSEPVGLDDTGSELWAALNGIYTIWYRDLLRYARDRTRTVGSLATPVLFLLIFGSGLSPAMGRLGGVQDGISYLQFMFPGIICMTTIFTSVFSAMSLVYDREFGFMKEVLVAPVPRWTVALGKALGGSTVSMIQGVIMLLLAPILGVKLTIGTVATLLPIIFVLAFALSALGLLISARMNSVQGFQMVSNFLVMPMFFLSGALFPLGNLPSWLEVLTRINPVSYGVDAVRQTVLAETSGSALLSGQLGLTVLGQTMTPLTDTLIVLAFGAVAISLAVRVFSIQE